MKENKSIILTLSTLIELLVLITATGKLVTIYQLLPDGPLTKKNNLPYLICFTDNKLALI
jgi:hypothetical protein